MAKLTKRLLVTLLVVAVVAAIGIAGFTGFVGASKNPEEIQCYKQGDVAQDGTVNKTDAIYLLYASIPMFQEDYPLNQECDFVKDDVINKKDALYLLFASIDQFKEDYPLKEVVHTYHDPVWSWSEDNGSAVLTLKCACSQPHVENATVSSAEKTAATCKTAGVLEITATAVVDGEHYTTTKEATIPATGVHTYDVVVGCETDAVCAACGDTVKAAGHKWDLVNTTEATCTTQKIEHYKCSVCQETKDSAVGDITGHSYAYVKDVAVEGQDCTYVKQYTCTVCHAVFDGLTAADTYVKHDYSKLVIQEATCVAEGLKEYYCQNCDTQKPVDQEKDVLAKNENHAWSDGSTGTITCTRGCGATKVVADQGKVSTNTLTENTSVALDNDIAMTMDQAALGKLEADRDIVISVDTTTASQISGLSQEQKAQIGTNPVYDISLVYDGTQDKVSDFEGGKVTVSLPYQLSEGEDVDSIDVWYINDEGQAVRVDGTYSNGYVTFVTDHFSYYTVTRLTAAERCQRYGHIEVLNHKDATCTEDGYDEKVCQRCGEITSTVTYPKTGHDYETTTVEATCTQDGSEVSVCGNCWDRVTKVLPALGHDLQVSKSTPATCVNTGVKVSGCSRCSYEETKILPQTDHTYVYDQEKSQEVTCTTAGFDTYICSCGASITKNEKAPLGHIYEEDNATWVWDEENIANTTLVLTCSHDANHTKVLAAVVTRNAEESSNVSCLGAGAVVHDAAASYNNVDYKAKHTVTVDAPGHQKGEALKSNANKHYYECTVCGEPLDAENHSWNDGVVTQEATCANAGSLLLTCTVCNYEKSQQIPATGEHVYEGGVCAGCGAEEDSCIHEKLYKTEMDLSSYGLCDGAKVYSYSCSCGENQYIDFISNNCNFEEDEDAYQEGEDENGFYYSVSVYVCKACGCTRRETYGAELDADNCVAVYQVREEYTIGGVTLGSDSFRVGEQSHPGITVTKTQKLEGLCGEELTYKKCPCGEYETISAKTECKWEHDPQFAPPAGSYGQRETCGICKAERVQFWKYQEGEYPCQEIEVDTTTYSVAGEEIASYQNFYEYDYHDYTVISAEKMGQACTDGLLCVQVCDYCGAEDTFYAEEHIPVTPEITDLTGADICASAHVQKTCLCDAKHQESYLEYPEGKECQWEGGFNEETNTGSFTCSVCSATYTRKKTVSDKDENCGVIITNEHTYQDENGNVLAVGKDVFGEIHHDIKRTLALIPGAESCEDGIIVTDRCLDCGDEESYQSSWHQTAVVRSYDLTALGSCYTSVDVEACACGQYCRLSWSGSGCQFEWESDGFMGYTEKCTVCGLLNTQTFQSVKIEGTCKVQDITVIELSRGDAEPVKFSYSRISTEHDYLNEYTLLDGALTCEGGYMQKATCQTCGDTYETGPNTGCQQNLVGRDTVTEGLCSTVTLNHYRCACGQYARTGIVWAGQSCSFENGEYDNELEAWVYTCSGCGATKTELYENSPIEGMPSCYYIHKDKYVYQDKDGNELFVAVDQWKSEDHAYVHTLHPMGQTCAEGYTVTYSCAVCGHTETSEDVRYDCEDWTLERTELHDGTGICGPIALYKTGCVCGDMIGRSLYDSCEWTQEYDEEKQEYYQYCRNCGVRYEGETEYTYKPDSCIEERNTAYRYYTVDETGETTLCQGTYVSQEKNHFYITTFTNSPESCTNGYSIAKTCYFCGYTDDRWDTWYDHSTFTTSVTDLHEYGMCGGFIEHLRCACGQEIGWGTSRMICEWEYQGDSQEGASIYHCAGCDTYLYKTEDGQQDPEACRFEGTARHLYVRGDETVLDYVARFSYERHNMVTTGAVLNDPAAGCDGGYDLIKSCTGCGKQETDMGYSGHDGHVRTVIAETGCGTVFYIYTCPCGKYSYEDHDWNCSNADTEYDSDGDERNGTSLWNATCKDCGLVAQETTQWSVEEGTCHGILTGTITLKVGDTQQERSYTQLYNGHAFGDDVHTLAPGAQSCEQGVISRATCSICGEVREGGYGGSHMYNREYIDLGQYGAVCGAQLIRFECACGQYHKYDIADGAACDLDKKETKVWIDGVISDQWYYDTEGDHYLESSAYTFICAVTEPEPCGLRLRMAEYWLAEGCEATEYQTWQYYDVATESWVTIDTVKTGHVSTYHDYVRKNLEPAQGDPVVTGWDDTCSRCGSTGSYREYTYADKTEEYVTEYVNTLDNGMRKKYTYTARNVMYPGIAGDIQYTVLERYDYVYGDGREFWFQTEYAYDFTDGCSRTVTDSNSDGWSNPYTEEYHREGWSAKDITQRTCTQFGSRWVTEPCAMCGEMVNEYLETFEPYAHDWSEADENGMYHCNYCSLESSNNASGELVLEDMTGEYGNGANYVVGYWNRGEGQFNPALSLVMDQVTDGDDVIDLSFYAFNYLTVEEDGILAVSFSVADAHAAAKAALPEGYEGTYAIRINFVRVGGGTDTDYAITFDSQN